MAERAREQGRDLVRRREAVCSLELRKETLALKRSLLEEAFQRAEEQLRTAEEDAYAQMMARLLAECCLLYTSGGRGRPAGAGPQRNL